MHTLVHARLVPDPAPRPRPIRVGRASLVFALTFLLGCAGSVGGSSDAAPDIDVVSADTWSDILPSPDTGAPDVVAAVDLRVDGAWPDTASDGLGDARVDSSDVASDTLGTMDARTGDAAVDVGEDTEADAAFDATPDTGADVPPPPSEVLGLPLRDDGVLYVGAAAVDVTPSLEDEEPDYLAGFGGDRVADAIHDPIWARALVFSFDRQYMAVVTLDLVGVTSYRAGRAATTLASLGWSDTRVAVHATHNHSGPDTVGMWGPERYETGLNPAYQEQVEGAIVVAVQRAAEQARPARMRFGSAPVGSLSPYLSDVSFGGKGSFGAPVTGLVRDTRDPAVMDDELTAFNFVDDAGDTIATVVHVNTHPEISGGSHHQVTSDFPHPLRQLVEDRLGGVAIHWSGMVGGLQTPLGVSVPQVDAEGHLLVQRCDEEAVADPDDAACFGAEAGEPRRDADGDALLQWTSSDLWARMEHYGRLLGGLAVDLVLAAEPSDVTEVDVRHLPLYIPVENRFLEIYGTSRDPAELEPLRALVEAFYPEYLDYMDELAATYEAVVLDFPEDYLVTDDTLCPAAVSGGAVGCTPSGVWSLRIGPLQVLTAPGELTPELFLGLPVAAADELDDTTARGAGSVYFPQHDERCDTVAWEDCRDAVSVDDCNCRRLHAAPYRLSADESVPPLRELGEAPHVIALGTTQEMGGYIVPAPDFFEIPVQPLRWMYGLGVQDTIEYVANAGDHYEELVSMGPSMTRVLQAAHIALATAQEGSGERSPE